MLSMTAQYALRAFVFIAKHGAEHPVLAKDIAARTGVPLHYLSRILRDAVRAGLLDSARGVGGGFRLTRPAHRIKLMDVLSAFDDVLDRSRCPFGQPRCNDQMPCGFHEFWKPISVAYRTMLEKTTLGEIDEAGLSGGRRRLTP
ncbi:HTH-type transcriptional regulator IscR [Phycisphaerae bacterium RAS2]|nr:HTH-type transcriptional regulator IscR [Phycisphaerae bacterium RAS2]